MSLDIRDELAMRVLPAIYTEFMNDCRHGSAGMHDEHWREGLALDAYMMADAMIAIRGARVTSTGFGDPPDFAFIRKAK